MANRIIVFVHGLGGDAVDTWALFPALLKHDHEIVSRYSGVETFQYATSILGASAPLSRVAHDLSVFIETKSRELEIDEIALIAHSQGGLLARRYLCDELLHKRTIRKNFPVFRLLTFATPHWGAYSSVIGKWMPGSRAQTKDLAFDSDAIWELNRDWSSACAEDRIKVVRIVAHDDAVVPKFSALGATFDHEYLIVNGYGHSEIVKVNDVDHPSFAIAKNFLLSPSSHQPSFVNADTRVPVLSSACDEDKEVFGNNRFIYSTRYVEFLGREHEKKKVMDFMLASEKENVSWMWIKGEGGVGKSRLALELCLACQFDWHAGFLNGDADAPDWARWQPQMPTLIVVDYATKDAEQLGKILRGLCNRDPHNRLRRPVRILLLDRQQQDDRLAIAIGQGRETIGINACRWEDLDVGTIDDPWSIIECFLLRAGASIPDKENALKRLIHIDPARRPLFAMLFADLVARGASIDAITRESLIENVLTRERGKYWKPVAIEQGVPLIKFERTLAFATIVNGLALDEVKHPLECWDADIAAPVFKAMSGYDSKSDTVFALAPDLIGECFAIDAFKNMSSVKVRELLSLAWNNWPSDTFGFFDRVSQDFPSDVLLEHAFNVTTVDEIGRSALSHWISNLIARTGRDFPARAKSAAERSAVLAQDFPKEPLLRDQQVKALFLLMATAKLFDFNSAINVLSEIDSLVRNYPRRGEIIIWKARAIAYIVGEMSSSNLPVALQFLDNLSGLATAHQDSSIYPVLAEAIFNVILDVNANDLALALALLVNLKEIVDLATDQPEVRNRYAKSVCNVIPSVDAKEAGKLLQELRSLVDAYPREREIRSAYASAISNLLNKLAASDPFRTARLLFELEKIAVELSDQFEVRLTLVRAAANYFSDIGNVDQKNARAIFNRVRKLAEKYSVEPELQLQFARAISNLINMIKDIDLVGGLTLWAQLSKLAAVHKEQHEIQYQFARATYNLLDPLGKSNIAEAESMVEELCKLAVTYPMEVQIRHFYVQAMSNLIAAIGAKDLLATKQILDKLRTQAVRFS